MNSDDLDEILSNSLIEFSKFMDEFDCVAFEDSLNFDSDLMDCSGDLDLLNTKVQLDL